MKQISLTKELIGEVFGTFILILLGDGVVANVGLAPRLALAHITGIPSLLAGHLPSSLQYTSRAVYLALTLIRLLRFPWL